MHTGSGCHNSINASGSNKVVEGLLTVSADVCLSGADEKMPDHDADIWHLLQALCQPHRMLRVARLFLSAQLWVSMAVS